MDRSLIDLVALAIFASDGRKYASREISLEQSWDMQPETHTQYRERAIVFTKVFGLQLTKFADAEIARLDATDRPKGE
jgi:hypothetical protein